MISLEQEVVRTVSKTESEDNKEDYKYDSDKREE